jgi:hypothetical protein
VIARRTISPPLAACLCWSHSTGVGGAVQGAITGARRRWSRHDGGVTDDDVRGLALALPGVTEAPHHERTSFRVGGKIFATMPPDGGSVNVLLDDEDALAAADGSVGVELLRWGQKLAGVRVDLTTADAAILAELLEDAWRRRAPKALVSELDAGR